MAPRTPSLHNFWINEKLNRVPDSEDDESVFEDQTLEELLAADLGGVKMECVAEREDEPSRCDARRGEVVQCGADSTGAEHRTPPPGLGASEVSVDDTQHGVDDLPAGEVLDDNSALSVNCTHQLREGGCCRNAYEQGVVSDTPSAPPPTPPPERPAPGTTIPPLVPPSSLLPATREAPAHRARPIWAAMHILLSKPTRYGPTDPALLSERFKCHPVQTAPQTSEWASTVALLRREVKLKKKIDLMVAEAGNGRRGDGMPERLREGRECVRELQAVRGMLNSGGVGRGLC